MKLRQRTTGAISKGPRTLSNSKVKFKEKLKSTIKHRKLQNILNLNLGALVGRACHKICKISTYQIFLDDRKRPCGKANIVLKLTFVIQKRVLREIQGGLSNKEKLRGCLTFDSGCTD